MTSEFTLSLALALLPASFQESPPIPSGSEEEASQAAALLDPPPLPEADSQRLGPPLSSTQIEARLAELVQLGAGLARLETIGTSRGGRPIQVLTLTDPQTGPADEKPAMLMLDFAPGGGIPVGDAPLGSPPGAEAILAFGERLISGAAQEGAHPLSSCTVYLAPALNPDLCTGRAMDRSAGEREALEPTAGSRLHAELGVRFDRNFPLGWRPDSLRPGSGNYPLSEPETLALAEYLLAHPNISLVVGFLSERGADEAFGGKHSELPPMMGIPAEDPSVLGALSVPRETRVGIAPPSSPGWELRDWSTLVSPEGGLFDYVSRALGMYPVAWNAPSPASAAEENQGAALRRIVRETEELLAALPRIVLEQDDLREIAPGLWRLDIALRNTGILPAESLLGRRRSGARGMRIALTGAELMASACRATPQGEFEVQELCVEGGETSLGKAGLRGGETRWLRLVFKAQGGSAVELSASSARGGRVRLETRLE